MLALTPMPAYVSAQAIRLLISVARYRPGVNGGPALCVLPSFLAFKSFLFAADICLVQKSALITGLSLALCGLTLVGAGEWAAGHFGTAGFGGGSATPFVASNYNPGHVAPPPASLPALPETSDHLPGGSPGYTFRRDIPEVRLQFSVADEQGRAVSNLSRDDVRVFDDQSPVPRFSDFERDENVPLQVGLVIDTSDSVWRVMPDEKAAARKFLDSVLHPASDSAFVLAFGGDVKLWQAPTADRQQLVNAIQSLKEPGWGTRFFDALYTACDDQLAATADGKLVRRAVVVLSDGDDTQSLHTLKDVIAAAQRSEIQIYGLTIRSGKGGDRGDEVLQRLAETTGGRIYVAQSSRDLDAAFAQIERDLRTQYFVSFPPQQRTPGYHSLRVEVRSPQKVQIHARKGYYAMAQ
jgi:Ca-activated chloride channel family protein